jgi:RNA polymerase sigma-70 factor (ECF subfamily)
MRNDLAETKTSDEGLVTATLNGDISAFGLLVERHWRTAFALALSRVGDVAEAEDVVQESLLKAYAQLGRLKAPSRFAGWLSKITAQVCIDLARANTRRRKALKCQAERTQAQVSAALAAYSSNPGLTEPQIQFVRTRIGELPAKARDLIIMRFVGGLSAVQIAEQLGQRPGTVRVWLHRAYNILRKDLAPLLEEVQS